MKNYFALLFLFFIIRGEVYGWGLPSGHDLMKFEAGYTTFRPYGVNRFLFGEDASKSFSMLQTIGITFNSTTVNSWGGEFDAAWGLHFFVPQEIVVQPDTLKYRLGGWELMTSIFGFDLLSKVDAVDLVVAPGVYWGNLHLRKYNSTGNFKANEMFKNPFIAPMIHTDLRFVIGRFAVGGRFSWRYDISKSRWKKGSSVTLPGYKCEEMQYLVYIGWNFHQRNAKT